MTAKLVRLLLLPLLLTRLRLLLLLLLLLSAPRPPVGLLGRAVTAESRRGAFCGRCNGARPSACRSSQ